MTKMRISLRVLFVMVAIAAGVAFAFSLLTNSYTIQEDSGYLDESNGLEIVGPFAIDFKDDRLVVFSHWRVESVGMQPSIPYVVIFDVGFGESESPKFKTFSQFMTVYTECTIGSEVDGHGFVYQIEQDSFDSSPGYLEKMRMWTPGMRGNATCNFELNDGRIFLVLEDEENQSFVVEQHDYELFEFETESESRKTDEELAYTVYRWMDQLKIDLLD